MKINTVHHMNFLNNTLPDKCANLIIADPPYYKVKGEFDFIWKNFDDYLIDVEKWALECKRLLADNGTLFWWGHANKIAYSQVIIDKYFKLLSSIVWEKKECPSLQTQISALRTFAPITERILMYSNEINKTGLEQIKHDVNNFKPLRDYFEYLQKEIKLTIKKINDKLGHRKAEHSFYWNSTQWNMPTENTYNQLIKTFNIDVLKEFKEYEELRSEYEELRSEYEELRRPFENIHKVGDVIRLPNYETSNQDHDTIKPEKLTRILITTCSRKNDIIVIPFAGSGTECAMAAYENRNFYGTEINKKYVDISNDRVKQHKAQLKIL